jgi:hypothetical protein
MARWARRGVCEGCVGVRALSRCLRCGSRVLAKFAEPGRFLFCAARSNCRSCDDNCVDSRTCKLTASFVSTSFCQARIYAADSPNLICHQLSEPSTTKFTNLSANISRILIVPFFMINNDTQQGANSTVALNSRMYCRKSWSGRVGSSNLGNEHRTTCCTTPATNLSS